MNLSKLALLSIISFSIASVSSAGSLATKVDPTVIVPGEDSSTKQAFTCENKVEITNGLWEYTYSKCTNQEPASKETLALLTSIANTPENDKDIEKDEEPKVLQPPIQPEAPHKNHLQMSDSRLKSNIRKVGVDQRTRLSLYEFTYTGDDTRKFIGVMADEVELSYPDAVVDLSSGFKAVNYDMLRIEFKEITQGL